jgi:hypothetical protein
MRAACESCGALQPPDWASGDLCVACGVSARREARCFWCARWTPKAKFCRHCGAEAVDERLYGAARMLKAAGTDQLTVPTRLRELDADRVENYLRMYQTQAAVVARHAEDLRFLERFLRARGYSAALEEELIPLLPLNEAALARLPPGPPPAGSDADCVRAIGARSPFEKTRALAAAAALRLGDWGAREAAAAAFKSKDGWVRAEAALALCSWRALDVLGLPPAVDEVAETLAESPFPRPSAVALALIGRPADPAALKSALDAPDPDDSFGAALALADLDRLRAGLRGTEHQRLVSAGCLARFEDLAALPDVLRAGPAPVTARVVKELAGLERAVPELAEALFEIALATTDAQVQENAVRALRRGLNPAWAGRLARAAKKEDVYVLLLDPETDLGPEPAFEVLDAALAAGKTALHARLLQQTATRWLKSEDFTAVARALRSAPAAVAADLVGQIARLDRPLPALAAALYDFALAATDARARERAVFALRRGLDPAQAGALARAANGDRTIFQSLLSQEAALSPESLAEVLDALLESGAFAASQYGLAEAAKRGAVADGFVPPRFARQNPQMQRELLGLAEVQLGARGDEELHRFVMSAVFGPYPAKTRAAAWWCLHRWYMRTEPRGLGPLRLSRAALERFFGSPRAFAGRLTEVLGDPATLKEVGYYDFLAAVLSAADAASVEALSEDQDVADALVAAACAALQENYWPGLLAGMARLLSLFGGKPRWHDRVLAALDARADKKNDPYWKILRDRLQPIAAPAPARIAPEPTKPAPLETPAPPRPAVPAAPAAPRPTAEERAARVAAARAEAALKGARMKELAAQFQKDCQELMAGAGDVPAKMAALKTLKEKFEANMRTLSA